MSLILIHSKTRFAHLRSNHIVKLSKNLGFKTSSLKQALSQKALFIIWSLLLTVGALLSSATANAITVYKTTGEFGEVKYSQFPPKQGTKVKIIELRSTGHQSPANYPNASNRAPTHNNPEANQTGSNQTSLNQPYQASASTPHPSQPTVKPSSTSNKSNQLKQASQSEFQQQCRTLQTNLNVLIGGGIIHETDSSGRTHTLSHHQIALKRENLQKMFNQYCASE